MNRRLILLNAVLVVVLMYGGVQLRNEYRAAKARAATVGRQSRIQPVAAPPFAPLPPDPAVMATGYNFIAQKFLFHPSRDPNVAHDPPPAPPPPPPPPPMPELPRYHGQMNLGDGPMALVVEHPGMAEKALKAGDSIGQFKMLDVNTNEITFQWTTTGETVRRSLRELSDHSPVAAAQPAAAGPVAPPPPAAQVPLGPGELTPQGMKTCQPNDSTPDGTVTGGFRKVSIAGPFGKTCLWEPVK
jgi:hypothetical protein